MKLTEAQCWDIIRQMVSDKYRDHASFVGNALGTGYDKLAGNIKRVYLNKFGFETELDFKYLIKKRGVQPKKDWIDNLSSEDLLIFMDYFCRSVQEMYTYYHDNKRNLELVIDTKKAFEEDTKKILNKTGRHPAFKYNTKRIKATGRPLEVQGEKKYTTLGLGAKELQHQALLQVVGNMAYKYARFTLTDIKTSVEHAVTLKTHTTNNKGFVEGFINNITAEEVLAYLDEKYNIKKIDEEIQNLKHPEATPVKKVNTDTKNPEIDVIGFNEHKMPIFMRGDDFVDILGRVIAPVEPVYDRNMNKIEKEQKSKVKQVLEYDEYSKPKFVGLDIQGTPIYEDEQGYVSSTGERVEEEDLFIDNTQDDVFGL